MLHHEKNAGILKMESLQIDGTLTTIEQQREALEGANTNTAVLTTMSEAAKADMDVDQVSCLPF